MQHQMMKMAKVVTNERESNEKPLLWLRQFIKFIVRENVVSQFQLCRDPHLWQTLYHIRDGGLSHAGPYTVGVGCLLFKRKWRSAVAHSVKVTCIKDADAASTSNVHKV